MVQLVERSSLLGVEEFARLILSNEPLEFLPIRGMEWNRAKRIGIIRIFQ